VWGVALFPARVVARLPVVEPVLASRAEELAAAGREAEARSRRRLDRALTETVPSALGDEAIDALARRLLESPAFERVLREAAGSKVARELLDDAVRSRELQHAVEEVLAGPAVRNALRRETKTLGEEVSARVREAAVRLDDAVDRRERTADPAAPAYAGLASRGVGLLVDLALTQLAALAVGALVGVVGSLLGLSAPDRLAAALAGLGWTLFVGGYFVLFWATAGQTPGMRLARVHVAGPDGRAPGALRSVVRVVGLALAIAPFCAGFLPVLFDRRRRALQDYLAGTVVVHDEPPAEHA
jgi:uncharacterized RDD family membrane protein YckC